MTDLSPEKKFYLNHHKNEATVRGNKHNFNSDIREIYNFSFAKGGRYHIMEEVLDKTKEYNRVVEVGCGECSMLKYYTENYNFKEIIGYDPSSTDLHEQVHASTRGTYDSGQIKAIKNITLGTGDFYGSDYDDGTDESPYGYDGNPEEIFAQLMQLRINNNIDPNKVFGKKDLPKLKKMVDKQGASGMHGLDVYEDEELLRLMNEVADSGTEDDGTRLA